jgi:hypothetical protein
MSTLSGSLQVRRPIDGHRGYERRQIQTDRVLEIPLMILDEIRDALKV